MQSSVLFYGVSAFLQCAIAPNFLQAHRCWDFTVAFWPSAQPEGSVWRVSSDEQVNALPGDLNLPGVLVYISTEGREELRGFVQYWVDWSCQSMRLL